MTVKDTVKDTAGRATAFAGDTLASASEKLQDATGALRDTAGDTLAAAREKVADAYEGARDYASTAAGATRDRASAAYSSARDTASGVRGRAADGIDESPMVALIGGVAIGVLLGALLPRSRREIETLGPLGDRLGALAKNALAAAKEAGQDTLDELGVNKQAALGKVDSLVDSATKAATSAGNAAADTLRSQS